MLTRQKASPSTVHVPLTFEQLLFGIRQLDESERATLELLLDGDFSKETLKRVKELPKLREEGKLLTLDQLKKELAK